MNKLKKIATITRTLPDVLLTKRQKSSKINTFSIVTANYNGAKYIDAYFKMLIAQTYDFAKIQVIIVDDGSTDESCEKIAEIQKQYQNVQLIKQENTGQAIARNNGLQQVVNEWVTFIDIDDQVMANYFQHINELINNFPNSSLIVPQLLYLDEQTQQLRNWHFLNYRFKNLKKSFQLNLNNHPLYFQMSMSSAFFKVSEIKNQNLQVRSIKPNFEDAFFTSEYLLNINNPKVVYTSLTSYLYLKRADNSSTIQQSGTSKARYTTLLAQGYLALLELAQTKRDKIPGFIKKAVAYDYNFNLQEFTAIKEKYTNEEINYRNQAIEKIEKLLK